MYSGTADFSSRSGGGTINKLFGEKKVAKFKSTWVHKFLIKKMSVLFSVSLDIVSSQDVEIFGMVVSLHALSFRVD